MSAAQSTDRDAHGHGSEMALNRLVFAVLVGVYFEASEHQGALLETGLAYLLFSLLVIAGLRLLPQSKTLSVIAIALLGDLGLLSLALHLGGAANALLFPLYLWIIQGNGFRFGLRVLFAASAGGLIGFLVVVLTTPYWRHQPALSVGLTISLLILPGYSSVLIRKLSSARLRAEEASRAKSMFLASISHELRTPLTAIIGSVSLIEGTRMDREQHSLFGAIRSASQALHGLIGDILDFSLAEAGQMKRVCEPLEPSSLLHEVRDLISVQLRHKPVQLFVELAPDVPRAVYGDRKHLFEVLLNLVGNAAKFTEVGEIRLVCENAQPGWLRFEIADTGIGISPEAQARIFEVFSQADATILDRFGGTGLGLAIARQRVVLMGGQIGVYSKPGEGSRFWFILPAAAAPELASSEPETMPRADPSVPALDESVSQTSADTSRLRVLIAEDNAINRRVLAKMLEHFGHTVSTVGTGSQALDALEEPDFDVVLMDVNMPDMNGLDATRLFRLGEMAEPHLPILALTADATAQTERACIAAGMDGCITKPVTAAQLIARIDAIIEPAELPAALDRPSTDPQDPQAVLDPEVLDELRTLGGEDFLTDLLGAFVAEAASGIERIGKAVETGDYAAVRFEMHALCSSAANVGASRLRHAASHRQSGRNDTLGISGAGLARRLRLELDAVENAAPCPNARVNAPIAAFYAAPERAFPFYEGPVR